MLMTLLGHRLAAPIASGIAVVLALALGWQTLQLGMVRGDLKSTRADLKVAEANYDQ